MKVYLINTVCGTGSTGRIVTALADILRTGGHSIRIAYGVGQARLAPPEDTFRTVSRAQYMTHNVLSRLTGREGLYSARQTRALIRDIEAFGPDLIHLHNLHGHYVNYELLFRYLARAGIPVVWTLHDCWPLTGHCPHFDGAGCGQWKTGCHSCSQLRGYPQCWTRGDVAGNFARKKAAFTSVPNMTLATPSHWMAQNIRASFLGGYPVRVIHNGIDLSVFRPTSGDFRQKHGLEDKFLLLGVAYQWDRKKGLDVFLRLSRELDDTYRIVLVGTDEQTEAKLPSNIISIRKTQDRRELAQLYTAADLFINPTREEAFGLVNAEALACGTPVLTFRTGGSPEIPDESCGSVVPRDDVTALIRQIRRIRRDRPYTQAACLARSRAFDADDRLREYLNLYESLTSD